MRKWEKVVLIESFKHRYHPAGKAEKGKILEELCEELKIHRKHGIRLLRRQRAGTGSKPGVGRKRGRKSRYDSADFIQALKGLWFITEQMGPRLLHKSIPDWLPGYERANGKVSDEVREKLLAISHATIERKLQPIRAKVGKGKSGTRPGNMLRTEIPIRTDFWDIAQPGFMEADTVAHCGGSLMGDFIWTLTMTDICTAWTELRVTWNKGAHGVMEQIKDIERSIPFELKGSDSDCGSEFINNHLVRYFCTTKPKDFKFTRGRAYHKNDNAHVEQKNWSIARRYLGYERMEFSELVPLINHYYKNILCPLLNHFFPSFKLKDKELIKSRFRRIYDLPQTPFKRLSNSPHLPADTKHKLMHYHSTLNPILLSKQEFSFRKKIDATLRTLKASKTPSQNFLISSPNITNPF